MKPGVATSEFWQAVGACGALAMILQPALDDADPKVRAAACLALGFAFGLASFGYAQTRGQAKRGPSAPPKETP